MADPNDETLKKWWWPIETFYGHGGSDDPYLTRFTLTPRTRWGQLFFHIFHRGDRDQDPHDHPWEFWTFPLQSYEEKVMVSLHAELRQQTVPAFRWSYRKATHTHIVLDPHPKRKMYTIVWRGGTNVRHWGFWVKNELGVRRFVPWRKYLGME